MNESINQRERETEGGREGKLFLKGEYHLTNVTGISLNITILQLY